MMQVRVRVGFRFRVRVRVRVGRPQKFQANGDTRSFTCVYRNIVIYPYYICTILFTQADFHTQGLSHVRYSHKFNAYG